MSPWPKSSTRASRRVCSSGVSTRTLGTISPLVRWISHSTSTWTRSRFRAASDRWSTRGATVGRYRPSRAPRAMGGDASASETMLAILPESVSSHEPLWSGLTSRRDGLLTGSCLGGPVMNDRTYQLDDGGGDREHPDPEQTGDAVEEQSVEGDGLVFPTGRCPGGGHYPGEHDGGGAQAGGHTKAPERGAAKEHPARDPPDEEQGRQSRDGQKSFDVAQHGCL